jgi:acyl carrier protein
MDQRAIEDLIIEFLAEDDASDPAELRQHLEEAGGSLAIDSVLAAEVVVRVEERCGVLLPTTAEAARCLGSVRDFAAIVHDLMESSGAQRTGEGA